jgi:hypothetical protein
MSKLCIKQLTDQSACKDQVDLFRTMFGESVNVTQKLCVSVADKFDFEWAASHLLTPSALADYERAKASAQADWERAVAPARADYRRAKGSAQADYERARAKAFAKAYNKEAGKGDARLGALTGWRADGSAGFGG